MAELIHLSTMSNHPALALMDLRKMIQAGHFPQLIYRYSTIGNIEDDNNRIKDLLTQRRMYFNSPDTFNDPFDAQLQVGAKATLKQGMENVRKSELPVKMNRAETRKFAKVRMKDKVDFRNKVTKAIHDTMKQVGLACFSMNWNHILQWSYYADGHRGLVIGFDMTANTDFFLMPMKVRYSDAYPVLEYFENGEDAIRTLLCVKSDLWKHENEIRIMKLHKGYYNFPINAIREIVFGVNVKSESIERVKEWCKVGELHHVKFYVAKTHKSKYELSRSVI